MVNPVLPQAVLAPAVAVVRADDETGAGERCQERRDLGVDPLDTGLLPPARFRRVVRRRERDAGIRGAVPRCALVPVGNVCLGQVGECEHGGAFGARLRDLGEQEFTLSAKARATGVVEALEIGGQRATGVRRGIEPADGAGADRPVAAAPEAVDQIAPFEFNP